MAFGIGFPFGMQGTGGVGGDITSTPGIDAPNFTGTLALIDAPVGTTYNVNVAALNTGGSIATYSLNGTLPTGLALNTSTGVIAGTTTSAATYSGYSVNGTNAGGTDTTNTDSVTISAGVGNINQPAFRDSLATTTAVNEDATFDFTPVFEQTTGTAPFCVQFQINDVAASGSILEPLDELSYVADYDDPTSTSSALPVDHPFGNGLGWSMGTHGAHVYDTPGTYTIKVYGKHNDAGGGRQCKEQVITVTDPDLTYPGTSTVVWSDTADYSLAPAGAQQAASLADAMFLFNVNGAKRLLLDANTPETAYEVADQFDIRRSGGKEVSTLGGVGTAYINVPPHLNLTKLFYIRTSDVKVANVVGVGDYDPVEGVGETFNCNFSSIEGTSPNNITANVLFYNCGWQGLRGNSAQAGDTNANKLLYRNIAFVNCTGWNSYDNDFISGGVSCTSLVGNKFTRDPLSVSGAGGKATTLETLGGEVSVSTGTQTYTLPNCIVKGDASTFLRVFLVNTVTNVRTRLLETTGWTFIAGNDATTSGTSTHQITLTDPVPAGTYEVDYYYRREGDHGPIRQVFSTGGALIDMNHADSYWSWSGGGNDRQPCVRINTSANLGGRSTVTRNYFKGGANIIASVPADPNAQGSDECHTLIDSNYLVCGDWTYAPVELGMGGANVRNIVVYRGNFPMHANAGNNLAQLVFYQVHPLDTQASVDAPIRVHNCTVINENTLANGVVDMIATRKSAAGLAPTTITEGNNLIYSPNQPTPLTDYTPLAPSNYGALLATSPAIDAGVFTKYVGADFFGVARGATNSIGATDQPENATAPPVSNVIPVANAGVNQSVAADVTVTLDGTGSTDSDGTVASYAWTQTAGTTVTLSSATASQPTFDAADANDAGETLTFSLVVTDNDGGVSTADTVDIVVAAVVAAGVNLLAETDNTDNTGWSKNNMTVSGAVITDSGGNNEHTVQQAISRPAGGTVETFSFRAKYVDHAQVGVRINPGGTFGNIIFDCQTGTLVSKDAVYGNHYIEDEGAGVYRFGFTMVSRDRDWVRVSMFDAGQPVYTSSGTSLELTDLQLELSSTMNGYTYVP